MIIKMAPYSTFGSPSLSCVPGNSPGLGWDQLQHCCAVLFKDAIFPTRVLNIYIYTHIHTSGKKKSLYKRNHGTNTQKANAS